MSQLNFLPISTRFGILSSRTDFWLNEFKFNPQGNSLEFNLTYSQIKKNENGKTFKTSELLSIMFTNVNNFKMLQYDEFEHLYSHKSNSNFDYVNYDGNGMNLYLLWTYDHCFEIYAKGYSFLPVSSEENRS
ncbi:MULTISPECIES: hypothetical protein [Acinetobacter]|uniref:hypothetical protein n=1 Tax=Acinetobacter TaxID=469 RepID=UPI0002CE1F83|nr:hypothetical protein [Acinetobacter guillouiae]MDN5650294.1 hypothetical protein [Acinetobacter sp.]ENU60612.1 hypothetical protein F981_00525 [Acinetobacter guillouiae CIP 63.46]EPH36546.1 hypothetical protein L291_1356 [Acinetobacter guillouiae MSP4-18]KAB0630043.1 hypothetical protein F7P82_01685 [Acinetobacter guillouiae]BAP38338.1 hypothetical protein AS4_33980 [Acinetobacter guillouiae]